jgi:rubrerythrin
MDEKKFNEIIQFAIQREIESMDFYDKASKMVKHSGTKDLFLDFMKQEEGHKTKLEEVKAGKIVLGKIEKIPDISYGDILRIAMKREERSVKLYTDLNEKNQDENLKNLFTFLIQEESKHKYYIEKLYDDEVLK